MNEEQRKATEKSIKRVLIITLVFFTLVFALVIVIPMVSAVPPFQTSSAEASEGYTIQYPKIVCLRTDTDYTFNFHIYNVSNGVPIDNATTQCEFHLYNNSAEVLSQAASYDFDDMAFYTLVDGNNIAESGRYEYIFWCNSSTLGGFVSVGFDVNPSGKPESIPSTILIIMPILVLLIISLALFGLTEKFDESLIGSIFKVSFLVMGFLTLLTTLHLISLALAEFVYISTIESLFGTYYNIITYVFWFVILGIFVYLIHNTIKQFKAEKRRENE